MKLESRKGMAAGALMARQFWFRGLTFRRVPNGGQVALAGLASKPAENENGLGSRPYPARAHATEFEEHPLRGAILDSKLPSATPRAPLWTQS